MAEWVHPNVITWEYRDGSAKLATLRVKHITNHNGGESYCQVTATCTVNGQRVIREFNATPAAQSWCEETMNPSKLKEPDLPGPLGQPPQDPVARLLQLFTEQPDLAWHVASRIHVLGPWEHTSEKEWVRLNVFGDPMARVVPMNTEFAWRAIIRQSNIDSWDYVGKSAEEDEGKDACDRGLREKGWLLAKEERT